MSVRSYGGLLSIFLALVVADARATSFIDTFEDGVNVGRWHFDESSVILTYGGNPGAFVGSWNLEAGAPNVRTAGSNLFSGNYRQAHVASVGADLITMYAEWGAGELPLALILENNNGTPSPFDDWGAYQLGADCPRPGQGWLRYSFSIPSDSSVLPPGWAFIAFGPNSPPNPDWNDLITNVTRISFNWGDPTGYYVFQLWDVGIDNARIDFDPAVSAPGGVDGSSWSRIKSLFR